MRLLIFFLFPIALFSQSEWQPLFNGENLDGWKKLNGDAEYRAENGEIIGISAKNTPNTFLATKENYGDFILELEVKVDSLLNSGIQFRSLSLPEYLDGRVHGYQAEVDPSPRAYSGGIYDEARRGWIYPLTENELGRKAFKVDDWNHYRIEAIGPEIRIWVNGVNTANVVDDASLSGFVALQVHSIWDEKKAGKKIKWRNIKIMTENLGAERKSIGTNAKEQNFIPNTLTKWEKENGWCLLWDGKSEKGWNNDFFKMKNGAVVSDSIRACQFISKKKYGNFELKVEFKFKHDSDWVGGVNYLYGDKENQCKKLEYHIEKKGEGDDSKSGLDDLAALYQIFPPENQSEPRRETYACLRWGEHWQTARIVVNGDKIEHWLNGFKLVSLEKESNAQIMNERGSADKWVKSCFDVLEGHIVLKTNKGQGKFRSIKIRELK